MNLLHVRQPTEPPIVLFGGTFDPPHNGHLSLLRYICDRFSLANIRVMPCYLATHKKPSSTSLNDRIAMVERFCAIDPRFSLELYEIHCAAPTFTVNTLDHLTKTYGQRILLVVGEDSLQQFTTWHRWQRILQLSALIVARRYSYEEFVLDSVDSRLHERVKMDTGSSALPETGYILVLNNPVQPAASRLIRTGQVGRLGLESEVPDCIREYIIEKRLYV